MATNAGTGSGTEMGAGDPQAGAFVRRSSGLVRDVSPLKALFFSMAAFFGGGIAFTFLNMTVTGQPLWTWGFTAYAWAAIAVGAACVLLGALYAILSSAMPRAGANYVFTSRILSPLVAWIETWCFVVALVAVSAVLLPLVLLMLTLSGSVMGIAFPDSDLWDGATGWFTNPDTQFIVGTVLVVLACLFAILPNRLFYRVLAALGILAVIVLVLMVVVTSFLSQDTFLANVTELTGQSPEAIIEAAAFPEGGFTFLGFMALCSFILFAYVGFQYAAFVSGEMSGSVKRSTYIAVLGALAIGVYLCSVYNDVLARKFGIDLTAAWAFLFWTGGEAPGGLLASPPTFGAIASPDLWPLWALCGLIAAVFTFLLVPVWFVVAARVILAWSLDRQAPEWLGRVNPRTNAPLNAIIVCAVATEFILYLSAYQGLALGSTLWLSILLFSLVYILPGVNALFARKRRPDLFGEAPRHLPWLGVAWLVAILTIYVTAIFKPLWEGLTGDEQSATSYLRSSGILAALIILAIGVLLYFANIAWKRSKGIESSQVFTAIPPD